MSLGDRYPCIESNEIIISGQSNLTKGRIAAAHERFSGIRQVALVCTPHTCFLASTQVHNPNGTSIGSAIFAQLTAECRRACPGTSFPAKIAHSHEATWTPSNAWFLGPARILNPNGISIGSVNFAQLTADRFCTLHWATLSPQNCPFQSEPTTQKASRSVQPFLQGSVL